MPWPAYWTIDREKRHVILTGASDFEGRSKLMNDTLRKGHESGLVPALSHWANEEFPLVSSTGEHVLDLDGCGVDMFGIINYSVHLTGWVKADRRHGA